MRIEYHTFCLNDFKDRNRVKFDFLRALILQVFKIDRDRQFKL